MASTGFGDSCMGQELADQGGGFGGGSAGEKDSRTPSNVVKGSDGHCKSDDDITIVAQEDSDEHVKQEVAENTEVGCNGQTNNAAQMSEGENNHFDETGVSAFLDYARVLPSRTTNL